MKKETIRSEKLIKNTFWATFGYFMYAVAGFVSRSIFVHQLGDVITGIATLFSSILGLLSLAELGFGSAITVHMYKPVAENNKERITALLNLYNRAYKLVVVFVLALGLLMMPVIHLLVKTDQNVQNLQLYFFLYILKSAASYCFAYKAVLLTVSQESYHKSNISNFVLVLVTIFQTAILHYTANFVAYLLVGIGGTLVTNIWISCKVDKIYPFLREYKEASVSDEEKKSIFSFIKATAVDRIASAIKTATDNMIVSAIFNVAITGIIGNYNMIIGTVSTFLGFFFNNASPAVGNLSATADKKTQYNTFLDFEYVTLWMYGFLSTGMLCTLTPFVRDVWIRNPNMLLPSQTLFLLIFNFFLAGSCTPASIFFYANGMIKKMPFINVINVLVNLVLSLWLVMLYDVDGVYIGTIVSYLLTNLTLTHYYVLRYHFEGNFKPFLKMYGYFFIVTAVGAVACIVLCNKIPWIGFLGIVCKIAVCTLTYNIIFVLASFRTREFHSIFNLLKGMLRHSQ